MRRTRFADQRGVSGVIVAVAMVMLIAMLGLSVDGGAFVLKRRQMVNANDSAALAYALSCAIPNLGAPDASADTAARSNVSDATQFAPPKLKLGSICSPGAVVNGGTVTVTYEGPQARYFLPVVGLSSKGTVWANASASWGATGVGAQIAPLMLSKARLTTCNIPYGPGLVIDQTQCAFVWDNGAISSGNWGLMNLCTWYVGNGCPSTGAYRNPGDKNSCPAGSLNGYRTWIQQGFPNELALRAPAPTYICNDGGSYGNALDSTIKTEVGQILHFPVNDPALQVDVKGVPCPPITCKPYYYAIVGFASLKVAALYSGQRERTQIQQYCQYFVSNYSNVRCLVTIWEGFQETGSIGGGTGQNFGSVSVGLTG